MNRTVKQATIRAYHYDDLESLKAHVLSFVTTYNFAKHLKALKWKTPFQSICDAWKSNPSAFKINPHHLIPGPHTSYSAVRASSSPHRLIRPCTSVSPDW